MIKRTTSSFSQDESSCKGKLWMISTADHDGELTIALKNKPQIEIYVSAGACGILACEGRVIGINCPDVTMKMLSFQQLCKIQAFIDECHSVNCQSSATTSVNYGYWPLLSPVNINQQNELELDFNFISQFSSGMEMGSVTRILRESEEYSLVRYLLQVSDSLIDLQTISARYGLSPSHFRRLMRNALGNGVKAELKKWRLTRAMLESFREEKRLTDTAMDYGYSSLSHFSTDVRKLFGLSHREIKQSIISRTMK